MTDEEIWLKTFFNHVPNPNAALMADSAVAAFRSRFPFNTMELEAIIKFMKSIKSEYEDGYEKWMREPLKSFQLDSSYLVKFADWLIANKDRILK